MGRTTMGHVVTHLDRAELNHEVSFDRIPFCIKFKATRTDLEMADCSKDGTPLLEEMDPMHLIIDEPAIRAARTAEKKKGEVECRVPMESMSESESRKRADEPDDAGHNGKSQPRSANRVAVKSGPPRTWYPREMKELPMALGAAHPRQTTGSGSRTRTPQEKTAEFKTRDPISQVGSYAVETLLASRVYVWNILITGTCVRLGSGSLF